MAELRTRAMATLTPTAQAKMDNADANFAADQALQAPASSEFSRGWNAAGLGEQANKLLWNAASAYQAGDAVAGQQLEAEGRRTAELARTWAPTVQNFTDIDGLGSGAKWAMGALGNVRSSIKPALASMAGGLAGGIATRSMKGAQLGAMAGSTLAGYDQMADETAGTAMMDPTIRATKGYDEILNTSRVSGAIQAPLEGLVPGAMGAMAMGAGKSLAKAGVKGAMAKAVGGGAVGEFGTELAQNLVGQGAKNSLQDKGLADDLDYEQALNAGAAGAVAGGAMGGVGGLSSIGHNATDAAVDVATDPRQLIDMGAAAAGKLAGQAKNKIDEQFVKLDDYVAGLNVDPDRRRVTGLPGEFHDERDLEGADIHAMRKPYADRLAAKILDPQSAASDEEKAAATNYAAHRDPFTFGDELTIADGEGKQKAQAQSIVDELNGTTKKSKMRSKSFGEIDFEVPASSIKESGSPPVTGKMRDDVTPEFTDRGPADPDVFAAKRERARRQGKEFFVGTTPGEKVGVHGRYDTRPTTPSMLGNMTERQALHRQLLNEEGRAKAEAVKDEARMNIGILADIWLKQGIDERIVSEVSQNVAPAQREAAVAIMSWVARGFKGADGEVLVPESLIKSYGKDASKLIDNAYTLAAKQGLIDPTSSEAIHEQVMKDVESLADRYGSDADVVFDAMTPIAQAKFTEALSSNSRKEYLSKMAPIAKAIRTIANGGEISKAQDAALDSWFGPRKNEVLDHFYEEKTQPKNSVDDGQDDEEAISGLAEDNAFAQREEQGLSQSTEHGFTKVKEEISYQHRDKGAKEAGEYFDLTNEEHRVALDELKAGRVRDAKEEGEDASLRTISTVGFVDRETEKRQHQKAVEAAGKRKAVGEFARSLKKDEADFTPEELERAKALPAAELTPSERRAAEAESKALHPNEIRKIRRELAERELGMKPPTAPGKDATDIRRKFHEIDLRSYDQNVDAGLARLNKNRVAVRVTKSEMPNDLGFTRQDVTDIQMKSLDLRGYNALVEKGVMVFDNGSKSGNYYATTARMIIAKVVSKGGDAGFNGSFDEPGNLVRLYRMLQDGVTSIMETRGFTRVGYIDKTTPPKQLVKPVWLKSGKGDQHFPDALPLTPKRFVHDAREQQKAHDAEQERQSVVERAILQSSGKAMQFLIVKRLRSFMLSDKDYARLGKDDSKAKTNHDVASKALADFNISADEGVLKQALKAITGSGELHYTPREAGMMLQLAHHMLTPKQVSYLRGLKNNLGRKPSDKRFIDARDATLKFFEKDSRFAELKKGTDDHIDWRDRAMSAINWKLHTARLADAATGAFNETGELEGVTNTLYDITGDEQYNTGTTPSENTRGSGPDDDIQEWGTLRDDPAKAVGTKGAAIHRKDRGMAKGDDDYAAGMLAGAGDSKRLVKDAVTGVREVKSGVRVHEKNLPTPIEQVKPNGGKVSMNNVVSWLRASASTFMRNVSDQLENDRLDAAQATVDRVEGMSTMSPAELVSVDPTLDEAKAARLIDRAKNVLSRARAMVDAEEGVGNGRATEDSTQKEVGAKQSKVKADDAKTAAGRHKAEEAAREHLTRVLGDKINVEFVKAFNDGTSGEWTKGATVNTIRLALNSDVLGTAYHESMHEFFAVLGKHGGETVQAFMTRIASNKRILNKLSQLLDGQPEAQAQLADPEEALAYMYQFWKAGLLEVGVGPETKSWFQKTADFLRGVLGMVTDEMRAEQDLLQAEFVLAAFDSGRFSRDDVGRQKLVDKINARLEAHDKAMEAVGSAVNTVVDVAGKYVLSAESVVENVKNTYMTEELRLWNQKTGSAMGDKASFFEAVSAKRNQYMNRLENLLRGKDEGDIELARKALSTGKEPTHPPAKELYDAIRDIMGNLFEYAEKKKVARLDPETHEWVGIQKRKDYYPQVWDIDTLMKEGDGFKALLLKHHMKELTSIADKATKEVKHGENAGPNTASQLAKPGEVITPEAVAEAILRRVLNSGGHVELDETTSDLGMSPVAAAVNRRELSWIDPEAFDAFKSKDLVATMTSYISSMVKRAEHTDRFGRGGEKTRERAQSAFLLEMGGEKLVGEAKDALDPAIDAWRKAKAAAMAGGLDFDEPFPTLRGEGERIFGAREGAELLKDARIMAAEKLEHAYKAVMAMEGTLGADISDNMRALNSWMMTYQNFRLLSTTLFSSFADVVGLVVNGGELGDAWDAFTTGIKEVKLGWSDKKSEDRKAKRAEMWGTVDAGSMMDALGQTYGSVFLTGTARRMSDALFKWNGMEAWNRAMRITATSVAERVIKQYQSEGFDAADPAAAARFEELFGKGFDPKAVKLDADGELDMNDLKNQAAVSKWVNGAILRPNAAQRTIWGSDPHYQMLWHMKQFTYTFQSVILAKAVDQAKLGNYRPALAAMAGYVPVIIAADAVKELLIPGDEPAWMKSGLAGMLQHGVDRAGLLGIGQMGYDAFATDFGVGLTGPAVSQVLHAPFDDPSRTALRALPFGNLAGRLAD